MGIAALILGIISLIVGFIPFCGAIAYIPAIIGLVLGIVEIVKKNKSGEPKGMGIAGVVLSGIALVVMSLWLFVFSAAMATADYNNITNSILNEIENNNIR